MDWKKSYLHAMAGGRSSIGGASGLEGRWCETLK